MQHLIKKLLISANAQYRCMFPLVVVLTAVVSAGCAQEEIPPALPVAAPLPPPPPKLSDQVVAAEVKLFKLGDTGTALSKVKTGEVFATSATVTFSESIERPEVRGMVKCVERRGKQTVIYQEASWRGKKISENQYSANVELKFPEHKSNHFVEFYIDGKMIASVPIEVD